MGCGVRRHKTFDAHVLGNLHFMGSWRDPFTGYARQIWKPSDRIEGTICARHAMATQPSAKVALSTRSTEPAAKNSGADVIFIHAIPQQSAQMIVKEAASLNFAPEMPLPDLDVQTAN